MLDIFLIIISSIVAIASPASPNQPNYVYIAEAKTNSLASSVLSVELVPETQRSTIAYTENKGEDDANHDFDTSEGLKLNLTPKNDNLTWIEGLIKQYSAQYSVSYEEMRRVMLCESQGKIDAVGDNGKAFGLYQFWENTFYLFAKDLGEKLEWKNPEHQIKLASWSFANGKQTHWTCWKNL